MPQVSVMIAGRTYRVACAEGEEAHLEALARAYDEKITEMRREFGEIGDMRLHVMAALTFVDQVAELRERISTFEVEQARMGESRALRLSQDHAMRRDLAERVNEAAERIERLSQTLASKPR
jgi:cell division protein ZapA